MFVYTLWDNTIEYEGGVFEKHGQDWNTNKYTFIFFIKLIYQNQYIDKYNI